MNDPERIRVAQIEKQLIEVWELMDELLDGMSAADWQRSHGPDWTFADLPWHLSYIDREFVVKMAMAGQNLPEEPRLDFGSLAELNAWNDAMISSRPSDQPVEKSLAQMREIREECRQMVAGMTDSDLEDAAWFPLLFNRGWRTKTVPIEFCAAHTYSHFMEARGRLGLSSPEPSPELIHSQLIGLMALMKIGINKEAAQETELSMVMNITGPGGGAWTIDVDHGQVEVSEGFDSEAAFVMTATPNTLYLMGAKVINPIWAMITRKLKIKGLRNMGTFGKLTAPPPLNMVVEPIP